MTSYTESFLPLFIVVTALNSVYCQELVSNGRFESQLGSEWFGTGFHMEVTSLDRHGGHSALKVTGRRSAFSGPYQTLHLKSNTRYKIQAFAKQLNDESGELFQEYVVKMAYANNGHQQQVRVVYHSSVRSADGWVPLSGYFQTPSHSIQSSQLHFQGPDSSVNFLLDDVSVTEVAEELNWKTEANARIENIRKGDIHLRVHLPTGMDPSTLEIQVDHKKHEFLFGSLVKDTYILDPQYKGYQDIVYDLFNVATLQSFKWKFDKGTQGHPNFSEALAAMHELKSHGLAVRGHNLFWGFTKNLPDWVPPLPVGQLNDTVEERLSYMVNITKGQLIHWDVMNELVHGQWFEERFQDPLYSEHLYREVHQLDPTPTLMLNDFSVVAGGDCTDAYLQQARQFLADGAPLQALGIQSHFHEGVIPDPTILKLRLDHLAQSGLPLHVTELNLLEQDPNLRADYYENVYRMYFSHPSVNSIVLWGFWDHHAKSPYAALVDGFEYTMNAAGARVAHLIKEEWSTHVTRPLTSGSAVDVRGFKGEYDVTIKQNGVPIKIQSFTLTGGEVTVDITLTGTEKPLSGVDMTTTSTSPSVTTKSPSPSASHVIGQATSSTVTSQLTCTLRRSRMSAAGDDERAQVTCHAGEVLTGCSSILKNHDWRRDGEQIITESGQPACVAVDGYHSTMGVQAVAVCCHARGLTCTYRGAGPSSPGADVHLSVGCTGNELTLGCSAWNFHSGVGGAMATDTSCEGINLDPLAGVYVYGSCCTAPSLSCVTVTSSPSGHAQGDAAHVQCDASYVMTGCNAVAVDGKSAGAIISGTSHNVCQAFNGLDLNEGQHGVKAVGRCCKTATESGLIG